MSRTISRCKGWSTDFQANSDGHVNVGVRGVCACSWHKECVSQKRCRKLFSDGGENGADRTLGELMGKPLSRAWKHDRAWKDMKTWQAKDKVKDDFERAFFRRCKPVVVEIRRRKV